MIKNTINKISSTDIDNITQILNFWFDPLNKQYQFKSTPDFDNIIIENYFELYTNAANGELYHWKEMVPDGYLALTILLDQFPRNMFRNDDISFQTDHLALSLVKEAVDTGINNKIEKLEQKLFIYLPYMHSENIDDQDKCCELLKSDYAYPWAVNHREEINRFGRFPERNIALNRVSTEEEI